MQQGIEKQMCQSNRLCGAGMTNNLYYLFPVGLLTSPLEIFPI